MDIEINTRLGLAIFSINSKREFAVGLDEYYKLASWEFLDLIRIILKRY